MTAARWGLRAEPASGEGRPAGTEPRTAFHDSSTHRISLLHSMSGPPERPREQPSPHDTDQSSPEPRHTGSASLSSPMARISPLLRWFCSIKILPGDFVACGLARSQRLRNCPSDLVVGEQFRLLLHHPHVGVAVGRGSIYIRSFCISIHCSCVLTPRGLASRAARWSGTLPVVVMNMHMDVNRWRFCPRHRLWCTDRT